MENIDNQNIVLFVVWIVLLIAHFIFSRTRYFNDPEKVIVDYDEFVIIRTNKITWLFGGNRLKLAKNSIEKIQLAGNCISFFSQGGNAKDLWVSKPFVEATFERAMLLFPNAVAIEIDVVNDKVIKKNSVVASSEVTEKSIDE